MESKSSQHSGAHTPHPVLHIIHPRTQGLATVKAYVVASWLGRTLVSSACAMKSIRVDLLIRGCCLASDCIHPVFLEAVFPHVPVQIPEPGQTTKAYKCLQVYYILLFVGGTLELAD